MKILIAGGSGFLGSHLCDALLQKGHRVIAADNLITGFAKNVQHLQGNPNFQLIEQDVTIRFEMEVDGIFNLACPASPVHYQLNPVNTLKTNILGSLNLLEIAKENGAMILQASTSEVYGDPIENPQKEEYWGHVNPIGIRACYDEGKRAAETLFSDFHRQYGTDIRIARLFNTYGPQMALNDGRVVSNFIIQALTSKPITVYGDGSQLRSFCYVDDTIDGLIKLFETPDIHSPINIGNPTPTSMHELAQEIIDLTGSSSKIIFEDLPLDDPQKREPDITKAKALLGWSPKISQTVGLQKTISYFEIILAQEH